jgi:hypothetical protein
MRLILKRWFLRIQGYFSNRDTPVGTGMPWPSFDLDLLREKFDVSGQGSRDGARNYPPPTARTPTPLEHDIAHYFLNAIRVGAVECEEVLDGLTVDVQTNWTWAGSVGISLKAHMDRVLSSLALCERRRATELYLPEKRIKEQVAELKAFAAREGLARPPRQPEMARRITVVVALGGVEALINGSLFSLNLGGGLVEGVSYAVGLAAINVGVAFSFGRWLLPLTNARRLWWRMAGWASSGGFICLTSLLNLTIAHFRSGLASHALDAGQLAILRIMTQPLGLHELNDYLLLLTGLAFACIAYAEGYTCGDPFPGYGALARELDRAHAAYTLSVDEWNTLMEAERDKGVTLLDGTSHELGFAVRRVEHARTRQHEVLGRFAGLQEDAARVLKTLLNEYRAANEAARSLPAPEYFSTSVMLPRVHVEARLIEPFDAAGLTATFERYREELNRRFVAATSAATIETDQERGAYVSRAKNTAA